VGAVVRDKADVVSISGKSSAAQALLTMRQFGVLSLPVENEETKTREQNPFIGVLDITDLLMFVAFGNFPESTEENDDQFQPTPEQLSGEKLSKILVDDILGDALKMQTGMYYSGVYYVSEQDSLEKVMGMSKGGVQRVIVKMENLKYKILSQMDILAYLAHSGEEVVQKVAKMSIQEAQIIRPDAFNELCTIDQNKTALAGFRKMLRYRSDAVACVDERGTLTFTLSPSDLRFLFDYMGTLKHVFDPLKEFVVNIHGGVMRESIRVGLTDSMEKAMQSCISNHVHRVWVVDEEDKPVACLRVQDIIDKFYSATLV
jgi:CBS domain-containing protein